MFHCLANSFLQLMYSVRIEKSSTKEEELVIEMEESGSSLLSERQNQDQRAVTRDHPRVQYQGLESDDKGILKPRMHKGIWVNKQIHLWLGPLLYGLVEG